MMELCILIVGIIIGAGLAAVCSLFRTNLTGKAKSPQQLVYDYDATDDLTTLKDILGWINSSRWEVIAVVPHGDQYVIIFRRPLYG
jgi:hypothetical protein